MATIQGLNKTRMLAIEAASIVAARLSSFNLILTTQGGTDINVGNVRGATGATGPNGLTPNEISGASSDLNLITSPSVWSQTEDSEAASGSNYPVPYGGILVVTTNLAGTEIYQSYTVHNSGPYATFMYVRAKVGSTWSAWRKSLYADDLPIKYGELSASLTTFSATSSSSAPGTQVTTGWTNNILVGFTYSAGTWTAQNSGRYYLMLQFTFPADTTADWANGIQVWKNGSQWTGAGTLGLHSKALGNSSGCNLWVPVTVAAGDTFQVSYWQNSGSSKTANLLNWGLSRYSD